MEELIEALLSLARVASGELHRSHCDMSGIAGLVAAELQLSEPYRQLQFHIEEGLTTDADERLVKVLMENLLGNAWKYTQKTSEALIEFGVTEAEGRTVYFVRDNGAGFAMENAHRLFKPFQRLHDSADFKGTGIGLATVQRIVDRHGGRVWCRGEVGRGATFYFTLDER
jgi:signal transduction histidine kinase